MKLRVAVLGAGSWGTTVASLTSRNASTTLWARDSGVVREIGSEHTNQRYLPGAKLPPALRATDAIEEALLDADILIMGIPAQGFRNTLMEARPFLRSGVPIVSLTKGLESGTGLRMTQVIGEVTPGHPAAALGGPNLAREIMAGFAAASVVAIEDKSVASRLQGVLHTGAFRVYINPDLVGCELGGALKNVIAIASGMADGLGVGDNTRAAVITRGLTEITRLGVAMGGQASTFAGLTGAGDLIATCISPQSRNRHVGEQLGRGCKLDDIVSQMHMVAEGVKSARVVRELGQRYGVSLPIVGWVCGVLYEGRTADEAYQGLKPAPRSESESD